VPFRDSPLRSSFWLSPVDARPLAALRIALGIVVLADLIDRLRDFRAFYTVAGLAARGGMAGAAVVFAVGILLAAAFTVGLGTRGVTVGLWLVMVGVGRRNPWVTDGGDLVVQALLFWGMFVDMGGRASLDVRLSRRPPRDLIPAPPVRMLQLQVALIYLATFLAKRGETWWTGEAVRLALTSGDWGRGLARVVAADPRLCRLLTYAILAVEGAFAPLVLFPVATAWTRAAALGAGAALHLGIFLCLRVGIFSLVMPVSYLALVPSVWVNRIAPGWRPPERGPDPDPPLSDRVRLCGLGLLFAAVVVGQATALVDWTLPASIERGLGLFSGHQDWSMFAPAAPRATTRWSARGELADGRAVDLTDTAVPELRPQTAWRYSRWLRVREELGRQPEGLLAAMGRYLCRRGGEQGYPAPLLRVELRGLVVGGAAQAGTEIVVRQSCVTERGGG
jgi:hypothetical protein